MAVKLRAERKQRPPFDEAGLEQAALHYAGRYATSRAKLAAYLHRKLRERGWAGPGEAPVERLIERMAALGYVDDRAFAVARATSLGRRGYGARRISAALHAAGVEEADAADAREVARADAWDAALRFARRRLFGPFAVEDMSRESREKALGALLRAGHPLDLARRIVDAKSGEIPDADDI